MIRRIKFIFILAFALALASCAGDSEPAQVYSYGVTGGAATDLGMRTVVAGDTPYTIAQSYNISAEDIIAVNHLEPPYKLAPGQRLRIPPPSTYTTQFGDTLYSVSRTFNVSETQIAQLNNLQAPYALPPEQSIRLPSVLPSPEPAAPVADVATSEVYNPPPPKIDYYTPPAKADVASGETPAVMPPAVTSAAPVTTPIAASVPEKAKPASAAAPVAEKPGSFSRPVAGTVISSYGDKPNGLHNDGINIKAAKGTPVHAAASGEVVYASSELKGFGNLILLRHAGGWMTAYAHLDSMSVKRGDQVVRGEVIGKVGQTGAVDSPQLHFEVRRGTEALNPVPFLQASS